MPLFDDTHVRPVGHDEPEDWRSIIDDSAATSGGTPASRMTAWSSTRSCGLPARLAVRRQSEDVDPHQFDAFDGGEVRRLRTST
jgi:hypothetical protein